MVTPTTVDLLAGSGNHQQQTTRFLWVYAGLAIQCLWFRIDGYHQ